MYKQLRNRNKAFAEGYKMLNKIISVAEFTRSLMSEFIDMKTKTPDRTEKVGSVSKKDRSDIVKCLADYAYDDAYRGKLVVYRMLINKKEVPVCFYMPNDLYDLTDIPTYMLYYRRVVFTNESEIMDHLTKFMERFSLKALQKIVDDYPAIFERFWIKKGAIRFDKKLSKREKNDLYPLYYKHSTYLINAIKTAHKKYNLDLEEFIEKLIDFKAEAKCHEVAINDYSSEEMNTHQHRQGQEKTYTEHCLGHGVSRNLRVRIIWEIVEERIAEDPKLEQYSTYGYYDYMDDEDCDEDDEPENEYVYCPYCQREIAVYYVNDDDVARLNSCDHYIGMQVYDEITMRMTDTNTLMTELAVLYQICNIRRLLNIANVSYRSRTFDNDEDYRYVFMRGRSELDTLLREAIQNRKIDEMLADPQIGNFSPEGIEIFPMKSAFETPFGAKDIPDEQILPMNFDITNFLWMSLRYSGLERAIFHH